MDTKDLTSEQKYFDQAVAAREQRRADRHRAVPAANAKDSAILSRARRERVDAMRAPTDAPAFGRIDLDGGDTWYIGYDSIIEPETQDVLVVNWKTKIGELYSLADAADPHGVSRKRAFDCDQTKIKKFTDYVYRDLARSLDTLRREPTFDDALLTELNRTRTGEMQDVVKTIQASQTPIIRAPLEGVVLVQGAPGTGKTVVALHRVSWLLYNYDALTADRILVVGPNPTFTRYIRGVVPALGDRDVRQMSIGELGPTVRVGRDEDHEVTRLKGESRMAQLLHRALWERVALPEIDDGLTLRAGSRPIRLDRERLQGRLSILVGDRAPSLPYMEGRRQIRTILNEEVLRQRAIDLRAQDVDNLLERIWPQYSAVSFLRGFLASRDRLLSAGGEDFTAAEIQLLHRRPAERVGDEVWSAADVILLDELEALLNGVPDDQQFLHVVADEAQDLSPMQLRALTRRATTGSMTVVGDIAQSTGPWARDVWDDVVAHLPRQPVKRVDLEFGYRVPRQVFDLAARLLPRIAPDVAAPRIVRDAPADPVYVPIAPEGRVDACVNEAMRYAGRGLSVGVIVPAAHKAAVAAGLEAQDVQYVDAGRGNLGRSINLVSPADAKGLEFDAVVVVEPEDLVAEQDAGERMLYVALTRTTKYLSVVHVGAPLPLDASSGDPSEPVTADEPSGDVEAPAQKVAPKTPPFDFAEAIHAPSDRATVKIFAPGRVTEGTTGQRPQRSTSSNGARNRIVVAVAQELATQVRGSLASNCWDDLIEALIDELALPENGGKRMDGGA